MFRLSEERKKKIRAERVKEFIVLLHILRYHLSTMAVKSACSLNFLWLNLERESLYYNVLIDFNRKRIKPRKSGQEPETGRRKMEFFWY